MHQWLAAPVVGGYTQRPAEVLPRLVGVTQSARRKSQGRKGYSYVV
jgi:hypothetical protein